MSSSRSRTSIRQSRARVIHGIETRIKTLQDKVVKLRGKISDLEGEIAHTLTEKIRQVAAISYLERQEQLMIETINNGATNFQDLRRQMQNTDPNATPELRAKVRNELQAMDSNLYIKRREHTRPLERLIDEEKLKISKIDEKYKDKNNKREELKKDLDELIAERDRAVALTSGRGKNTRAKRTKRAKKGGAWTLSYKRSINCRRPRGFSQKQYCKYRKK